MKERPTRAERIVMMVAGLILLFCVYWLGPLPFALGIVGGALELLLSLGALFAVGWLLLVAPRRVREWWAEHWLLRWQLAQLKRRLMRRR